MSSASDCNTVAELAAAMMERQRANRAKRAEKLWRPTATPATDLGYECERRTVYHRTIPEAARKIEPELASIFAEGDMHARDVHRELLELGFELVEGERNFRDEGLQITGSIDGRILLGSISGDARPRRVPVEIKSTAGDAPTTEGEWRASESWLLRRYYAQVQTYCYLTSEPEALGLFKDKITGLWTVTPVTLDYEYAETLLKRAERIRDAIAAGVLPERLASRSECKTCPFFDTCLPGDAEVDPLLLAEDEGLASQIDRILALDEARREFEKTDKAVKERFKLTKGERFAVGSFLVTKKKHGAGVRVEFSRLEMGSK